MEIVIFISSMVVGEGIMGGLFRVISGVMDCLGLGVKHPELVFYLM